MRNTEIKASVDKELIKQFVRARPGVARYMLELALAREYNLTPQEVIAVLLELEAEERQRTEIRPPTSTPEKTRPKKARAA
jgi:hypothetical protein